MQKDVGTYRRKLEISDKYKTTITYNPQLLMWVRVERARKGLSTSDSEFILR